MSRDVGVAIGVGGNRAAAAEDDARFVGVRPAEIGGVDNDRIDDERLRHVVRRDVEADLSPAIQDVAAVDELPLALARPGLVDRRPAEANHLVSTHPHDEVAVAVDDEVFGPLQRHAHRVRVGARRDDEVEFQFAPIAVIDRVDAGIHVLDPNPGVAGHIGMPLGGIVADEIVARTRQPIRRRNGGIWTRPHELHTDGRARAIPFERQNRRGGRQEEAVPSPARDESHSRVRLPVVCLEAERKPAVMRERADGIDGRGWRGAVVRAHGPRRVR